MSPSRSNIASSNKILLKEVFFNLENVTWMADQIQGVHPTFARDDFITDSVVAFPDLELKARMHHLRDMLTTYLPKDFQTATHILLESLPPELDPTNTDDDFGIFILSTYGEFIALHGCCDTQIDYALRVFPDFTKRFSMEFALRPFLKKEPTKTLKIVKQRAISDNYHVRRLASEGIRPNLPRGGKVDIGGERTIEILSLLYTDQTKYVLRSVANNLNDLTKLDAHKVIQTLTTRKNKGKQSEKHMSFLITHALRTELKKGNPDALSLLGYHEPEIIVSDIASSTPQVQMGESAIFSFSLSNTTPEAQHLLITYRLFFMMANGTHAPKVFQITKKNIHPGETLQIEKSHPLRKMTTKKLYPGTHTIEIIINGVPFGKKEFELTIS